MISIKNWEVFLPELNFFSAGMFYFFSSLVPGTNSFISYCKPNLFVLGKFIQDIGIFAYSISLPEEYPPRCWIDWFASTD